MQNNIEKLKEFTKIVKDNLDSMYREGSAERHNIDESNVVNTMAVLELTSKIESLIEILTKTNKVVEPKKEIVEDKKPIETKATKK